ncbi:MAG: hypothetical protein R2764_15650 [Bacteroidales bacterium]
MMSKLMYTCEQATQMVIKRGQEKLTKGQKIKLWMHLAMCKFCRLFEKQSRFLDEQAAHLDEHCHEHLTKESKSRILESIEK